MSGLRSLTYAANGRRSKGPVTAAGKRRSSGDALRHGLLVRRLVLEGESIKAFRALLAAPPAGLAPEFRPVSPKALPKPVSPPPARPKYQTNLTKSFILFTNPCGPPADYTKTEADRARQSQFQRPRGSGWPSMP
jgi:hypothetical protein